MTLLLCALLACCSIPVSTQAGCGVGGCPKHYLDSNMTCVKEITAPGRGSAPADSIPGWGDWDRNNVLGVITDLTNVGSRPATQSTTPGLYELQCAVDTAGDCRWVHGERWINLPCPGYGGKKTPPKDGYVIDDGMQIMCAVLHRKVVPDSTWVCENTIDTTCVWVRHECAPVDSLGVWEFDVTEEWETITVPGIIKGVKR